MSSSSIFCGASCTKPCTCVFYTKYIWSSSFVLFKWKVPQWVQDTVMTVLFEPASTLSQQKARNCSATRMVIRTFGYATNFLQKYSNFLPSCFVVSYVHELFFFPVEIILFLLCLNNPGAGLSPTSIQCLCFKSCCNLCTKLKTWTCASYFV